MFIDHIAEFIPNIPIQFHWIGRVSAPIFFFTVVEGYIKTSDKLKFFIRLYLLSVIVEFINMYQYDFFSFENYYNNIDNNIIQTLLSTCIFIWLIEKKENKLKFIIVYVIWQIFIVFVYEADSHLKILPSLISNISPVFFLSLNGTEGGLIFVVLGLVFYFSRNSKSVVFMSYSLYCLILFLIVQMEILPRFIMKIGYLGFPFLSHLLFWITLSFSGLSPFYSGNLSPLFENYQWMMIFALPFICCYGGDRGLNLKYLFYVFYPIHILLLFYIGNTIYNM